MSKNHPAALKAIRFADELLPGWACLLDLAARMAPVNPTTRRWFAALTRCSGSAESRAVIEHCTLLLAAIEEYRESIAGNLARERDDGDPAQILAAWKYALETMRQAAEGAPTVSWIVPGTTEDDRDDLSGGDVQWRRV